MTFIDYTVLQTPDFLNATLKDEAAESFTVSNPATGEVLTRVVNCGAGEAELATEKAAAALAEWKKTTAAHRADLLYRCYELLLAYREELAQLMVLEQGKAIAEARGEVEYSAGYVRWFAEEARRAYGRIVPAPTDGQRILVRREAVGVVAVITPWNFPLAMLARKVAPALAAGCCVVAKPSEETPLCALALEKLALRAGVPAGVFSVVPTLRAAEVGRVLTTHPAIKKLSFTGSTAVGKTLMEQCAGTLKKLSLELGGNAPFIVFDDADLKGAVAGAMVSKYRNAGQTCICANRIFVQEGIYADFLAELVRQVRQLQPGDGRDERTTTGPLINDGAVSKVKKLVAAAISDGAKIHYAAESLPPTGSYYPPTILTEARNDLAIAREEVFGPVATIIKFRTEDEVLRSANDTPAGLAAYFFTRDADRIWRMSEGLAYGMVGVNTGSISTPVAPFGGVKESGFGREGGQEGIGEYLVTKYVNWQTGNQG